MNAGDAYWFSPAWDKTGAYIAGNNSGFLQLGKGPHELYSEDGYDGGRTGKLVLTPAVAGFAYGGTSTYTDVGNSIPLYVPANKSVLITAAPGSTTDDVVLTVGNSVSYATLCDSDHGGFGATEECSLAPASKARIFDVSTYIYGYGSSSGMVRFTVAFR